MIWTAFSVVALCFAAIPAYVFFRNVTVFRRLPMTNSGDGLPTISVLIPARNEEASIGGCVRSVLGCATEDLAVEVVVLDDQSEDATATVVQEIANADSRVRLESSGPLPTGWCGKQHACAELARLASHDLLIFLDADVRLSSDALRRIASQYQRSGVGLLSGFPRQRTESLAEQMLIPLMHFVLLGFLSLRRMRRTTHPAFGAGCGQLFITSKTAYAKSGGHAQIRRSLHDGLKLPRLFRSAGLLTDLFDASDIASCRMYCNASEVWHGLKKNATEGIANATLIVPVTAVLLLGQVLPFAMLAHAIVRGLAPLGLGCTLMACFLAWSPRIVAAFRYRQSYLGALLHPFAIVTFLFIQWTAFLGSFSKQKVSWKGRPYPAS